MSENRDPQVPEYLLKFSDLLFDWALGYERVEIHEFCDGTWARQVDGWDLARSFLGKNFRTKSGFAAFKVLAADLLKGHIVVIPKIIMSDKRDVRYDTIVREFVDAHPQEVMEFWLALRENGL